MGKKKELEYFKIGSSYGGNQKWMLDPWMHIGGCAALTTCDAFIYFALHMGRRELCPFPAEGITKKQYRKFAMSVKLYLQPRETGIKDLDTYMDGVRTYLEDGDVTDIRLTGFDGNESSEKAGKAIIEQIDADMPVAYLMLNSKNKDFDFFQWHWFIVNGYELRNERLYIKAATYGKYHWLDFEKLWDTGESEKGGMVFFSLGTPE